MDVFKGKVILVTGGCGSIGSEIVKQLLSYNPKSIRVFDNSEHGHFKLNQRLKSSMVRNLIGDVSNKDRVMRAMEGVDIVFHAAALKHVPLCEYNPFEAVNTNVIGTKNLIDAAIHHNVERFIGISTDKAVTPVNTMGATKLLSEKIITNAPIGQSKVKFCCVRFGNVLASSGSVIPIFKSQIRKGEDVTITSTEMTRFFMGLSESVTLVLKSATLVEGGEIFILKMDALKIEDLADVLIEELALEYGRKPSDIKKSIIGVRQGEKLHEGLMTSDELTYLTETEDMFILRNSILAHFGKEIERNAFKKDRIKLYNSKNVKHLTKEEIKKKLVEMDII